MLPNSLLVPAKHFFAVARSTKRRDSEAILIGGAAVALHGIHRSTKDLDVNVVSLAWTKDLQPRISHPDELHKFSRIPWYHRPPSEVSAVDLSLTYMDPARAMKFDIVIIPKPRMDLFMKYSLVSREGICFADVPLLLALKINCASVRREHKAERVSQDLYDIANLLSIMHSRSIIMPPELFVLFNQENLRGVLRRVGVMGDQDVYKDWFREVGIDVQ